MQQKPKDLDDEYRAMAGDEERERAALGWAEALIGDVADEDEGRSAGPPASVPAAGGHDVRAARAAAERLRELAREMGLGRFDWEEWKAYRDTGRR